MMESIERLDDQGQVAHSGLQVYFRIGKCRPDERKLIRFAFYVDVLEHQAVGDILMVQRIHNDAADRLQQLRERHSSPAIDSKCERVQEVPDNSLRLDAVAITDVAADNDVFRTRIAV